MASRNHLDDDDDFGSDFSGTHNGRRSGNKRSFGDLEDDEDDLFSSKKGNSKVEETAMILSLRESLARHDLATCQAELCSALHDKKAHSLARALPFSSSHRHYHTLCNTNPFPKISLLSGGI
ncbi:unnamed protein product [Linum trigynum]|uniref:Uncharacterized protein n=1 Tax=Linum trigynum TaxID=586398 RepID=A0AAV2DA31_9ROSI